MNIRARHWVLGFGIAVFVHASSLALLWSPAESGSANLGVGGMDVAFGTAGGAPGAAAVDAPEVEAVEAPTDEAVDVAPEPVVEEVAEVTEAPVEPVTSETVDVAEVAVEVAAVEVRKKPKPPEARPVPVAEPKPVHQAVTEPTPVREPAPKRPPTKSAPSVAGSAGKSGTQRAANVGSGTDRSSGGRPGNANDYYALLQAWLEKYKEYPPKARRRRHEGMAHLTFSMDAAGKVLSARIVRSSGSQYLDEEVMKMIRRAQPLPPIPSGFNKKTLTLSIPVNFSLR